MSNPFAKNDIQGNFLEELILELSNPKIREYKGKSQLSAKVTLFYRVANGKSKVSDKYIFNSPLGSIEMQDLYWYLERHDKSADSSKDREKIVEENLSVWGKALYESLFLQSRIPSWKFWKLSRRTPYFWNPVKNWLKVNEGKDQRLAISVKGLADKKKGGKIPIQALEELLSLPWELLNDGNSYLIQQNPPVGISHRLPGGSIVHKAKTGTPIRVLTVSPRPDREYIPYIDYRLTSLPLVEVMENSGELLEVKTLALPSPGHLQETLESAMANNQCFDVVYLDGCGFYDEEKDMEYLYFESSDGNQSQSRRSLEAVSIYEFANMIGKYRIPLVFLKIYGNNLMKKLFLSSLSEKLLQAGVTSVVNMHPGMQKKASCKFFAAFYGELAQGCTIGKAMLAGQKALMGDSESEIQDWFASVLYQTELDPPLFMELLSQEIISRRPEIKFGRLPETPKHDFVGRSRELMKLERMLQNGKYAVVRGQGGAGKTSLAIELARWMLRIKEFEKTAFIDLDRFRDMRSTLDNLGKQVSTEGEGWTVAGYDSQDDAIADIKKALVAQPALIVIDNVEVILPDIQGNIQAEALSWQELSGLCDKLLEIHESMRIIFTSRESLPEPFNDEAREMILGAMEQDEAVDLVKHVMALEGWTPRTEDPDKAFEDIKALVNAANCHPRALVLLAREISHDDIKGAKRRLDEIMVALDAKYPGNRELSLYASLELSLRRMEPESQEHVKALVVAHGGVSAKALQNILPTENVEDEEMPDIFKDLIEVGLGEYMGNGYLRIDPALPSYLKGNVDMDELANLEERWAESMAMMNNFLYDQYFQNTTLSSWLIIMELPNLMWMMKWVSEKWNPEKAIEQADKLETLLTHSGNSRALTQVTSIREEVSEKLKSTEWNHARFLAESARVKRMLTQSDLPKALERARKLLDYCLSKGINAYPTARYDTAMAYLILGRTLRALGETTEAFDILKESQNCFQALLDNGNMEAGQMVPVSMIEIGDCLRILGQLHLASRFYVEAVKRFEELGAMRSIANTKERLGTLLMYQGNYSDAMKLYEQARALFESLKDPSSVASVWHNMGIVYRETDRYDQAEEAYKKALEIQIRQGSKYGEANALNELGNLYNDMQRLEDAVVFYRRAGNIYTQLGDKLGEGKARSNTASSLMNLKRYDEARKELERAIECKSPMGDASQPWRTWHILYELEMEMGNEKAGVVARERALQTYLDYRKAGGEIHPHRARLYKMLSSAIDRGDVVSLAEAIPKILQDDDDPYTKALIPKLQSLLKGDHSPYLADDDALLYIDAVEIKLLLENLKLA